MPRPFATSPLWPAIDWLGDKTAIPEAWSVHLLSLQCGFIDRFYSCAFNLLRVWWQDPPSLFMNGAVFMQLRLPFWLGLQIRFSQSRLFQCGLGWKANGRLAILFRFQTDASAAAGMDFPNSGQASGFSDGTH